MYGVMFRADVLDPFLAPPACLPNYISTLHGLAIIIVKSENAHIGLRYTKLYNPYRLHTGANGSC